MHISALFINKEENKKTRKEGKKKERNRSYNQHGHTLPYPKKHGHTLESTQ